VIIDTHAHVIVPEILREASPDENWRPSVYWEGDKQIIDYAGKKIKSTLAEFVHIDRILEAQDKAGVDHVLLCPWVSILRYTTPIEEGLRISRIHNEGIARLAQENPTRVSGLGSVPMQDPEAAARELEALMKIEGMHGVEISASVNDTYPGDESFEPFWAAAEETDALVFIHPTIRAFDASALDDYYMWNTVGNPTETAIAAAHMIMSGVMERHPNLRVLLAHGGGTLLSLRGRLRHSYTFQPQAKSRLTESPEESLKRFYFDTLTHDATILQNIIDYVGADHVMVGSDYPFDMGVARPADIVKSLGLPEAEEAKILGGNAARLLNLDI